MVRAATIAPSFTTMPATSMTIPKTKRLRTEIPLKRMQRDSNVPLLMLLKKLWLSCGCVDSIALQKFWFSFWKKRADWRLVCGMRASATDVLDRAYWIIGISDNNGTMHRIHPIQGICSLLHRWREVEWQPLPGVVCHYQQMTLSKQTDQNQMEFDSWNVDRRSL